ncbi:hypothetical protein GLOIN_2v1480197 [Rhizophagus irregularis DAOM 181602=DAOM 197198]|nr:hypothetical protein GLOIN_2v1480197 [Rhizophagus irregularis DAOM 181602=DAOM 197198]
MPDDDEYNGYGGYNEYGEYDRDMMHSKTSSAIINVTGSCESAEYARRSNTLLTSAIVIFAEDAKTEDLLINQYFCCYDELSPKFWEEHLLLLDGIQAVIIVLAEKI